MRAAARRARALRRRAGRRVRARARARRAAAGPLHRAARRRAAVGRCAAHVGRQRRAARRRPAGSHSLAVYVLDAHGAATRLPLSAATRSCAWRFATARGRPTASC